ncbi:MAG: hypothetical protein IJ107_02975 [Lachnospiraceae bacterium]|nr:hypothetical protein [Lachnospiraceae bacterium]
MEHLEIERKYLIRMPDASLLSSFPSSRIEQIYILTDDQGRERIRCRESGGKKVFTHTAKKRLSDLTRIEIEDEITEEAYTELAKRKDPDRNVIRKTRYLYDYRRQVFEIDVFPFWVDRALMELELQSEDQQILLPPDITVVRDVTAEKAYTNASIARAVPKETL